MRISDWSSDVCSSDLAVLEHVETPAQAVDRTQHVVRVAELARLPGPPQRPLGIAPRRYRRLDRILGSRHRVVLRRSGEHALSPHTPCGRVTKQSRGRGTATTKNGRANVCTTVTNTQ